MSLVLIVNSHTKIGGFRMATRDKTPSEFGGKPGRVQGDGHELTPAEEARLMRATEPTDPADTPQAALVREWDAEGRI